jgi:hypothetical protein
MEVLKRKRSNWDYVAIVCYIFMVFVIIGEGFRPAIANAGDVQWSIQWHWQVPHHHRHYPGCGHHDGYHGGSIGTGPRTHTYHNGHWYPGRYGYHYHQGRRYPVVREYHNYHGELCREFQMEVNIGGRFELAWGVACRDHYGHWRLSR